MINFLNKLNEYGYRRAFVYLIVRGLISVKMLFSRYLFSDNSPCVINSKLRTPINFVGKGVIHIRGAQLGLWPSPYLFSGGGYIEARSKESKVSIGEGTVINNNFTIIADRTSVTIGRRCFIGPNFFVVDSDFHGLEVENRQSKKYKVGPVIIEDDVFIGEGVRIAKNVTIGRGSIIGVGSLVTCDVEPDAIYAGNPARKIRSLK